MGRKRYDREKWGKGPWDGEPDRVDFTTAVGLPGLLLRGPMGSWCGYAGVGKDHPFFGREYTMCVHPHHKPVDRKKEVQKNRRMAILAKSRRDRDLWYGLAKMAARWSPKRTQCGYRHSIESKLSVHGGITYSGECSGEICHPSDNGDHVWWFGFDTAHYMDLVPEMYAARLPGGDLHDIALKYPEVERERRSIGIWGMSGLRLSPLPSNW